MFCRIFWPFLLLLALLAPVQAAVDLVTLPTREGTQLTIYNSEDITMVREHRLLRSRRASTASSSPGPIRSSTRPPSSSASSTSRTRSIWSIPPFRRAATTPCNGTSRARSPARSPSRSGISPRGITWAADYVGIANEDETKLNVTGYVRVTNGSGEVYDNAQTRLVVGKINLVEKIADLARRPPPSWASVVQSGRIEAITESMLGLDGRTMLTPASKPR